MSGKLKQVSMTFDEYLELTIKAGHWDRLLAFLKKFV